MASCITKQWSSSTTPQARLTVVIDSLASDGDTAALDWTLEYVAHGYAANTSVDKNYTVTINGSTVKSGTYDIDGITGTKTIASGTVNVAKTTSTESVSFGLAFGFLLTWSGKYAGTQMARGEISIPAKTSYTVAYSANGGSGAPSSQTKWYGTTLKLSTTKPTRTGYTFKGWGTSSTATTVAYASGANYTSNSAVTLYAIWTANSYKITFNANGGTGGPTSQTKYYGTTLKLTTSEPTRSGYNFLGWSTSASATYPLYSAGANYAANSACTLYAVWQRAYSNPTFITTWIENGVAKDALIVERRSYDSSSGKYVADESGFYLGVDVRYQCRDVPTTMDIVAYSVAKDTNVWQTNIDLDVAGAEDTIASGGVVSGTVSENFELDESSGNLLYNSVLVSFPSVAIKTPSRAGYDKSISLVKGAYITIGTAENNVWGSTHLVGTIKEAESAGGYTYRYVGTVALDPDGEDVIGDGLSGIASGSSGLCGLAVPVGKADPDLEEGASMLLFYAHSNALPSYQTTITSINTTKANPILELDSTFIIYITVNDQQGSSTISRTLSGTAFVLDLLAGGKGIAFGKPAELEDSVEFGFKQVLSNNKTICGTTPNGKVKEAFNPQNTAGNTVLGYGNYDAQSGNTNIYGYDVNIGVSNIPVKGTYRPYRRKGDAVTISIRTAGYVTNSGKDISFFIPMSVPVIGSPTVTVTSGNGFTLRQGESYTHGSTASTCTTPASYSATLYQWHGIHVTASFEDTTNVTNNDAIGIYWNGTITFS